jgi:hypothetical protein
MSGRTTGSLTGAEDNQITVPILAPVYMSSCCPFSCTFTPLTVCTPLRPNWLRILGKRAVRNIISIKSTRRKLLTDMAIVVTMLMLTIPVFERIT